MELFYSFSFDMLAMSAITCLLLREALVVTLPNRVAGPGGWLVNTDDEDR
ncbi:MAG: hypothetical protein AAFQ79_10450 [Pseudomonadota bacterium]